MTHRLIVLIAASTTVLLGASVGSAEAQDLARRIGIGSSCGYNAPTPVVYNHSMGGCYHNGCWQGALQFGCCEFPANWRLHVWDDYPQEPLAQRWAGGSLHPVAPVPPPMRTIYKRQAGGYGGMNGNCPTCQPGVGTPSMTPGMTLEPAAPAEVPVAPSARRVPRDRSI